MQKHVDLQVTRNTVQRESSYCLELWPTYTLGGSCPMTDLSIQDLPEMPDDILHFPDFVFGQMARRGIGSVEATTPLEIHRPSKAPIAWQYFSRTTHTVETIAEVRRDHFRAFLARCAMFTGISPYGGQCLFSIEWPVAEVPVVHRFSLFLCNEPTMAFWIRIYLYGIDGVFPLRKSDDL